MWNRYIAHAPNSLKSEWFLQRPQHALTRQLPSKREKSLKWTQMGWHRKKTLKRSCRDAVLSACRDHLTCRRPRCPSKATCDDVNSMSRYVESVDVPTRHCIFVFVLYGFGYLDVLTAHRFQLSSLCISFRSISCLTFFQVLHRWRVPLQSFVLGESFERQTRFHTVLPKKTWKSVFQHPASNFICFVL